MGAHPTTPRICFVASCQFEEPLRLFERLPRLYGHSSVYAGVGEFDDKVCGQEIAAQCGHTVVDPFVFGGGVAPEVVMCIDDRVTGRHDRG